MKDRLVSPVLFPPFSVLQAVACAMPRTPS
jgi:hypothetical protein